MLSHGALALFFISALSSSFSLARASREEASHDSTLGPRSTRSGSHPVVIPSSRSSLTFPLPPKGGSLPPPMTRTPGGACGPSQMTPPPVTRSLAARGTA